MVHTLISYIFDLFRHFVRLAQKSHVICGAKVIYIIAFEYVETILLMHDELMYQLKMCVATGSDQHLFATAPLTFNIFYPVLAR